MIARVLLLLLLVAPIGTVNASKASDSRATRSEPVEILVVEDVSPLQVTQGDTVMVTVRITIAEGHHVQAKPAANEFLVPLQIEFERQEWFEVQATCYPPARSYRLDGASEELWTYGGAVDVAIVLEMKPDAPEGEHEIDGTLHYQACNARMCLFPASTTFEIFVVVER